MSVNYLTPVECLHKWEHEAPEKICLRQPRNRIWQEYSWEQVADEVRRMAAALMALKLEKGSRVAIISKNCAEWIMADLAIMMSGCISVPLYPMQSLDSMKFVLEHSGASLVFVGKLDNPQQVQGIIPASVTQVGFNYANVHTPHMWNDLIKQHEPIESPYEPSLDDTFTIVYTSGTTGNPKGVVHNFRSASFSVTQNLIEFKVTPYEHFLSYLPLAHVVERMFVEMGGIYAGFCVSFVESLDTFAEDLRLVSPTRFIGVPRIWSKFQQLILEKLPQKKLDTLLNIPLIGWLVKKKIRRSLGLNNTTMQGSGAAPLPVAVLEWFSRLDIDILEGYGMTENLCYGSCNPADDIRFGTVGKLYRLGEAKISAQGEVLLKSQANMQGYYLDDEKTQEVMQGGYYHTGDKGEISSDGYLTLLGRIKDTFKTAKGEFITPSFIEGLLAVNTSIEQVCVLGLGLPQPLALVVLSAQAQAKSKQVMTQELETTFHGVNKRLSSHEVLNGLIVVKEEWLPGNGLMTPTLKIKRNQVAEHYRTLVEKNAEVKAIVWE